MIASFEKFFPSPQHFASNKAFGKGVVVALDSLRTVDLELHGRSTGQRTYPPQGRPQLYQVAEGIAQIVGAKGQHLPIVQGDWQRSEFGVEIDEGATVLQAGLHVTWWGRDNREALHGVLSARCEHSEAWQYMLVASLLWDEASQGLISGRTDGSTYASRLKSQGGGSKGTKIRAMRTEGDSD